jgi:hypothetical protein
LRHSFVFYALRVEDDQEIFVVAGFVWIHWKNFVLCG